MPDDLGARIRERRERRGWTQAKLAELMRERGHKSLATSRQSEVETGQRKVTAEEAISYARIFGIALTDLLGVPDFEDTQKS